MSGAQTIQTIGILGGGQLGRMMAQAAQILGFNVHIYAPEENSPAFKVTHLKTCASYDDMDALKKFAINVDIVTLEFENIPLNCAKTLENLVPFAPNSYCLEIGQDRASERQFLTQHNIPTTPHKLVKDPQDIAQAIEALGLPLILKTTRLGYDGKGQIKANSREEAERAFDQLGGAPLMAEKFISFDDELSVIVARDNKGNITAFEPALNVHKNHILHTSTVPSGLPSALIETAQNRAIQIAQALEYVGVLAVEYFKISTDGNAQLLVNEIAPRVHNSGHWTQNGAATCQFEQHIRAVTGLHLGPTTRHSNVVMLNLIGEEVHEWQNYLAEGGAVHLYGKKDVRDGRKMGHVNLVRPLT